MPVQKKSSAELTKKAAGYMLAAANAAKREMNEKKITKTTTITKTTITKTTTATANKKIKEKK